MADLFEGAFGDQDRAIPVLEHDERLFQVESHKIPLTRLIGQDPEMATNSLQDWEIEKDGVIPLSGVKDGEDVTSFNSQGQDSLEAYVAHLRESWKVTKVAGLVKSASIKNMVAHQRKKALERLRMKIERAIGSTIEMQRGSKTKQYRLRGGFTWLINSLQTLTSKAVPSDYRPSTDCIHTTALDNLTDEAFEDMVNAASLQVKDSLSLTGMVGLKLKSHMSSWTQKVDYSDSTTQALQQYNLNAAEKRLLKMVNTFEFDAGMVEVMTSHNLAYGLDGVASAYSPYSGLFLNLDVWKKRFMQHVKEFDLVDGGGGKRGYCDALLLLKCGCPAGNMAVYANAQS